MMVKTVGHFRSKRGVRAVFLPPLLQNQRRPVEEPLSIFPIPHHTNYLDLQFFASNTVGRSPTSAENGRLGDTAIHLFVPLVLRTRYEYQWVPTTLAKQFHRAWPSHMYNEIPHLCLCKQTLERCNLGT